jgi:hypothetical protein
VGGSYIKTWVELLPQQCSRDRNVTSASERFSGSKNNHIITLSVLWAFCKVTPKERV